MLCLLMLQGVVSSWILSVLTVGAYTALWTSTDIISIFSYHLIGLTYTLCRFTGLCLCAGFFQQPSWVHAIPFVCITFFILSSW